MTRNFKFDDFRTGTKTAISVEVTERTTFMELCGLLVEALAPITDVKTLSLGVFGRGSLVVLDTAHNVQIGRVLSAPSGV
jgi:hypothetical protein